MLICSCIPGIHLTLIMMYHFNVVLNLVCYCFVQDFVYIFMKDIGLYFCCDIFSWV